MIRKKARSRKVMRKRERENPKGRKSMFRTGENSSTYRNFREGLQRGQKIEISKKKSVQ